MRKSDLLVRNILVIDLELNQPSEKIIELGYIIGNPKSGEIVTKNSILVDPGECLSNEIIALTGITQDMVNKGQNLQFAYEIMLNDDVAYNALNIIHQWGVGDTNLLKKQLGSINNWNFGRSFIDVKALSQAHSIIHGMSCYGGLRKMAGRLNIEMSKEKQHRADYDAEITFLVYNKLSKIFLQR